MLSDLQKFIKDYEDCSQLARFQGVLKAFNEDQSIDNDFKQNLDKYFNFRWNIEKSAFIGDEITTNIPSECMADVYIKFCYK